MNLRAAQRVGVGFAFGAVHQQPAGADLAEKRRYPADILRV
jgi:hypothetical protein